eukprot:366468-Chlamydomonas_euryale.AAC.9
MSNGGSAAWVSRAWQLRQRFSGLLHPSAASLEAKVRRLAESQREGGQDALVSRLILLVNNGVAKYLNRGKNLINHVPGAVRVAVFDCMYMRLHTPPTSNMPYLLESCLYAVHQLGKRFGNYPYADVQFIRPVVPA